MPLQITTYVNAVKANYASTQKGVLKTVIKGAAQAKAICPVAESFGGNLRNSIGYSTELIDGGYNGSPGEKTSEFLQSKGKGLDGYYGTAVDYAPWVERGTRRMVAQPYLEPSAEILRGAKTAQEVAAELEKEFKAQVISGTKATRRYSAGQIAGFVNS